MKTTIRRKTLLASAAVAVMGLAMSAQPAKAFDEVNWTWESTVTDNVTRDFIVTVDAAPESMAQLEKIQMHVGDVNATSTVTNFENTPPGEQGENGEAAPIPLSDTFTIEAPYFSNQTNNPVDADNTTISSNSFSASNISGWDDQAGDTFHLTFDVDGNVPAPAPAPIPIGERDAADLPHIESAATAVGNNQNIESGASLALHDGQYLVGGFTGEGDLEDVFGSDIDSGNRHHDIGAGVLLAAGSGMVDPATISADSTVTGILNASVDSDATAVGNNISADMTTESASDIFMMGDVTQVAYADVSATSLVDGVSIEGYTGLGAAGFGPGEDQVPAISSVATAVGNNMSMTVSGPDVSVDE